MRFVTYFGGRGPRVGALLAIPHVLDLADLNKRFPSSLQGIIEGGPSLLSEIKSAVDRADRSTSVPLSSCTLAAPLPVPKRNIFCVGRNFHDHIKEIDVRSKTPAQAPPRNPVIFTKAPSCVIGPGAPVPGHLDYTNTVDYEGELAVLIGKPGRSISKADALDHVFGYSIFNDVTSRKLQRWHDQWFLGKSLDGFGPMGPAIVTRDELPDIKSLRLRTLINGELRQDESLSNMIFDIPTIIETISRTMHLEPGDVIAMGTPAGVGLGFQPPRFLKPGDEMVVQIDGLGELRNAIA